MKKYKVYQELSLPWLSEIPAHWEIRRNKNFFTETKDEVGTNSGDYVLLSLTKQGIIPRDMDAGGKFPSSFDKYKIVRKGDMAFCLFDIDETPRTVGLSQYDGMLTGAYTIMQVDNVNPKYIYYYYLALDDVKALRPLYTGLRKTIDINTFQGIKLPIPPRAEQDQIVRYLDWKVSEINRLIILRKQEISRLEELKRSQIGNLVMGSNQSVQKKSEVTWVNSIPQNWDEVALVQVAQEQKIKNTGLIEDNLLSLSYGKIINKDINTTDGLLPASFEGYQIVHPGNIILRLTDLQNDHKSLRTGYVTQTGIITSAYTCLESRNNILPEYLQLQLHTADLCKVFYGMGGGVRQSIGFDEIRKMIIALPPINEQREIIEEAHGIESPIDAVSNKYKEIISLLEEYKTKLISDVVTGQVDVRGIEIPQFENAEDVTNVDSEDSDELVEAENEEV